MKVVSYLGLVAVLIVLVPACSVKTRVPGVKVSSPSVEIDAGHDKRKGRFCPPGQAKKGRC